MTENLAEKSCFLIHETFHILQKNLVFWRLYFSVLCNRGSKIIEEKMLGKHGLSHF